MLPEDPQQARAALARAGRAVRRHPGDVEARQRLDDLRAEYRARVIEVYIRDKVAAAPPLTAEQRARLSILLTGAAA